MITQTPPIYHSKLTSKQNQENRIYDDADKMRSLRKKTNIIKKQTRMNEDHVIAKNICTTKLSFSLSLISLLQLHATTPHYPEAQNARPILSEFQPDLSEFNYYSL